MMMTPEQIALVQESFARVAPIAPQAAAIFYDKLFAADPSLRAMFRGDMAAQGEALMRMIAAAVRTLDQPEHLVPVLRNLGRRHDAYGVKPQHYDTVGGALIATLEQGLGPAFDMPTRAAWVAMYTMVSRTMQAAVPQQEQEQMAAAA